MEENIIYWLPVRTCGGTEKNKMLECSKCRNMINMYDIENLRFEYANNPEIYKNAIKTQYYTCEKCGSKMDTNLTHELRQRKVAKGDYEYEELQRIIKEIMNSRGYKALRKYEEA